MYVTVHETQVYMVLQIKMFNISVNKVTFQASNSGNNITVRLTAIPSNPGTPMGPGGPT